jgi:hypothetical protein
MNKLIKSVYACSVALLLSVSTTAANAGSSDFAGIYGAVYGSVGGAQIDGTHTSSSDSQAKSSVTNGIMGGVFPVGGYELGFNLPLGDIFFLGVGRNKTMSGAASIVKGKEQIDGGSNSEGDAASDASFELKAKSMTNTFIMPSISVYDNSAVYLKYGKSIAQLDLSGATGTPNNLSGALWGVGTMTMTNSGIFVKTEASLTHYDDISIVGVGGSSAALVEGTPDVVQGTIALGFKF